MTLNEFTSVMTEICGGLAPGDIKAHLTEEAFQAYCDRVGDLGTDHLREAYGYWHHKADEGQFFTPESLAKLVARLTETGAKVVRDLCCGCGSLTIEKWKLNPDRLFLCYEKDPDVIPYLLFNLAVRNMSAIVENGDVLPGGKAETFYVLTPQEKFSRIDEMQLPGMPEASGPVETVSNPPFNMPWSGEIPWLSGWPKIPKSNANYAFILQAISSKSAVILPAGVMSDGPSKEARRWLVENGYLEHVISLAGDMFAETSIPVCVFVLNDIGTHHVRMSDYRDCPGTEQRDRNGMFGGASHEGRTYHKVFNIVTDEQIDECCKAEGHYATIDDIEKEDWVLSTSRYLGLKFEEKPHRPFKDICQDLNRIAQERSSLKLTINEPLAKSMGIDESMEKDGSEDGLDKHFQAMGVERFKRRYVYLTKSRTVKLEFQGDEAWNHFLKFWLREWKAHIYYLNEQENRLLAEMRDALLPELMDPAKRSAEIDWKLLMGDE